jgi:hypothetical protein
MEMKDKSDDRPEKIAANAGEPGFIQMHGIASGKPCMMAKAGPQIELGARRQFEVLTAE